MSNLSDDQEQPFETKDEVRDNNSKETEVKTKEGIISKNKPAALLLIIIIFCSLFALVGYLVTTNSPKFKYIKAMSEKPVQFNQAVLSGNLDIEKYELSLNTSNNIKKNFLVKPLDLSGTKIAYDGQFSFNPRKMMVRVCINYNNQQYPVTAYMTDNKLVLSASGFFDMYQINVPEKQKIRVPEYIYTGEKETENIHLLWSRLENTFNDANKSSQQDAIEELVKFIFKALPDNYFSKDGERWLILAFDRLGLKEISDCVVEEVWHNDKLFAQLISEAVANDNSKNTKKIEKDILAAIENVSLNDAKENTYWAWTKFDKVVKLNRFSLALKNEHPDYNTAFIFDCNIEKSSDFPNGGKIVLKGDNKITVNKVTEDIKLPDLNEQNSINIKDIKL